MKSVIETPGVRLTDEQQSLVLANLPLIYFVAGRYRGIPTTAFEDLVGRLYYRLCLCISRFEPERGYKLSPYVVRSLEGDAKNFFRDSIWMVRPPRRLREGRPVLPDEDGSLPALDSCVRPVSLDTLVERPEAEMGGMIALTDQEIDVEADVVGRIGGLQIVVQILGLLQPEEKYMLCLMMKGRPLSQLQERFQISGPQARRVWRELQQKAATMYLGILEGEYPAASLGSEALAEILRRRFEPEVTNWFDVRQELDLRQLKIAREERPCG